MAIRPLYQRRPRIATVSISARLPPDVLLEVERLAERLRVTRSELVLQAIEAYLQLRSEDR